MNLYMVYVYGHVGAIWDSEEKAEESLIRLLEDTELEKEEEYPYEGFCGVEKVKLNEEF